MKPRTRYCRSYSTSEKEQTSKKSELTAKKTTFSLSLIFTIHYTNTQIIVTAIHINSIYCYSNIVLENLFLFTMQVSLVIAQGMGVRRGKIALEALVRPPLHTVLIVL